MGDIQRAIINNVPLTSEIRKILDKDKIYATTYESLDEIIIKMRRLRAECMPIVNDEGELKDVIFWKDVFKETNEAVRFH